MSGVVTRFGRMGAVSTTLLTGVILGTEIQFLCQHENFHSQMTAQNLLCILDYA